MLHRRSRLTALSTRAAPAVPVQLHLPAPCPRATTRPQEKAPCRPPPPFHTGPSPPTGPALLCSAVCAPIPAHPAVRASAVSPVLSLLPCSARAGTAGSPRYRQDCSSAIVPIRSSTPRHRHGTRAAVRSAALPTALVPPRLPGSAHGRGRTYRWGWWSCETYPLQ